MISKFSKAFAGYIVSKGGLISEGIFNLVPRPYLKRMCEITVYQLFNSGWKKFENQIENTFEIKLPLSKRGHFFNAQKNLRHSADPHKSPKTWFDRRVGVAKYGVG